MFAMSSSSSSSSSSVFLLLLLSSSSVLGFYAPSTPQISRSRRIDGGVRIAGCDRRFVAPPILRGSISKWNENAEEEDDEDTPHDDPATITGDEKSPAQKARRKKRGPGGGEHRAPRLDDDYRDSLPFVVAESIPDPYTPPDEMVRAARKNSDANAILQRRRRRRIEDGGISATVRSLRSDGTLKRVLGEFVFDSNTNCGDLLHISDKEYEVVSARSQFRYAGGRRFVLVRKVLEVKEITRIAEEASLRRLMERGDVSATGKNFE
jgi:hypothetical protein